MAGLCPGPTAGQDGAPAPLPPATVRTIFRLVSGQPDLKDHEIGAAVDAAGTWTCVWTHERNDLVIVLQVRDADGAYRRPDITDLSSLKFGMRPDLRERIEALVREGRKKK